MTKRKRISFKKKFDIVKTLQQNVSNRSNGGDGSGGNEGFNGGGDDG